MGLLEKALQYYSLEAEKKTVGILAKAALYSKSLESPGLLPTGLLAKAEQFHRENQSEGLIAKAQRFGVAHVPRGMKVGKVGLLEKALRFAAVEGAGIPELEKVAAAAPSGVVAGEVTKPEKTPLEKIAARGKVLEEEEAPETESLPQIFEKILNQEDPLALLKYFTEVFAAEGYASFCTAILETCMGLGKGKSAFLVTAQRRGYREDTSVISESTDLTGGGSRRKKISIGKSSKLIRYISDMRESVVPLMSVKDEKVLDEITVLKPYESWTIVPLSLGDYLAGFILIGNQAKKPRMAREHLLTLARLAAFFIVTSVIERNADAEVEKLSEQREELLSLLQLHNYSIMSEMSLSEVFADIAAQFEIQSGVVMAGWEGGGSPEVVAAVGLSEKGVARYRISKSDRGVKSILREGVPGVPDDVQKRLNGLLKEDRENANTAIIAPIQFYGQTLGVIVIHRMKGVTTRLSNRVKNLLQHIAQSMIPFLLYNRMTSLEPFEVFESLLKREAARARKGRSSLHVVAFKVKNFKAILRDKGFDRYRRIIDRFSNLIRKKVEERGLVHILSLNKVVLLLVMKDAGEADDLIKEVKSAVSDMLEKEKEKLPLTFSPLRTVYPNESRSIGEILQLIE